MNRNLRNKIPQFKKFKINFHFRKNITGRKRLILLTSHKDPQDKTQKMPWVSTRDLETHLPRLICFAFNIFLLLTFKIFHFLRLTVLRLTVTCDAIEAFYKGISIHANLKYNSLLKLSLIISSFDNLRSLTFTWSFQKMKLWCTRKYF